MKLLMERDQFLFDEFGRPGEEDLLAAADRAMYRAKASGGGAAALAPAPG